MKMIDTHSDRCSTWGRIALTQDGIIISTHVLVLRVGMQSTWWSLGRWHGILWMLWLNPVMKHGFQHVSSWVHDVSSLQPRWWDLCGAKSLGAGRLLFPFHSTRNHRKSQRKPVSEMERWKKGDFIAECKVRSHATLAQFADCLRDSG